MTFQKVRIAIWMTILAVLLFVIYVFGWGVFGTL